MVYGLENLRMSKRSLIMLTALLVAAALAACSGPQGNTPPTLATDPTTDPNQIPGYFSCPPYTTPAESGPGTFTGEDGLGTIQKGPIFLDQSGCSSVVTDLEIAENWIFQGTAGQDIVINVKALGDSDPQVTLIDPNGEALGTDDDSGGGMGASLDAYLELDGIYTFRVEMFEPGVYTINVLTGTPEPDFDPAGEAAP
jgi:hypothetical protein